MVGVRQGKLLLFAFEDASPDGVLDRVQSLRPDERGGRGRIIARHVAGQASGNLGVFNLGISENFAAERGKSGIVLNEFGAGVHMGVIVVRFAVVIEPRLHAFGEILAVVHAGVFGFPQVNSLEARIDNRARWVADSCQKTSMVS